MSSYGIEPLAISEAFDLYNILAPFVPEYEDQPVFEFVGTIVNNIAEAKSPAYGEALMLMTKKSETELAEFGTAFLLELFLAGFTTNDFLGLRKFCRDIGYGG